jgi:tetraacyldisaccharide 4'-kinase
VALDVSVLVLDAAQPWGAGVCPPAGDLRAPVQALWQAANVVLWRGNVARPPDTQLARRQLHFCDAIAGARAPDGALLTLAELARRRLGLVLALARPERVERELARHGVHPQLTLQYADHAELPPPPAALLARAPVAAWLTTAKCATKLGPSYAGAPLLVLEQRVELPPELVEICTGRAAPEPLGRGVFAGAP